MFTTAKKIYFSAIIILFLFAIGELALWLVGFSFQPHYSIHMETRWTVQGIQPDPTLPWSWIPIPGALCHIDGRVDFRFNQIGYRGPLFKQEKEPGTLRIVCMGDSGTMGWGVKDGQMYCSVLEDALARTCKRKAETINAGVFGYSSFQGVHQLAHRILPLHPDLITICYNWNDHGSAIRIAKFGGDYAWQKGTPVRDKDLYHPHRWAVIYQILSKLRSFQLLQYAVLHASKLSDHDQASSVILERVPIEDYEENLIRMIEMARENNILPVLLTQAFNVPKIRDSEDQRAYEIQKEYNENMREKKSF